MLHGNIYSFIHIIHVHMYPITNSLYTYIAGQHVCLLPHLYFCCLAALIDKFRQRVCILPGNSCLHQLPTCICISWQQGRVFLDCIDKVLCYLTSCTFDMFTFPDNICHQHLCYTNTRRYCLTAFGWRSGRGTRETRMWWPGVGCPRGLTARSCVLRQM